jgi:Fe-S oxidoreductase/nitrate reductase gamma subunit
LETRELWWNIDQSFGKPIFYLLASLAIGVFIYGFSRKFSRVFSGKALKHENRFTDIKERIRTLLIFGLGQRKVAQKRIPGLAHLLVFLGFLSLWIVTDIIAFQEHSHINIYFFQGLFYKLISCIADIGGVLLLTGVLIFTLRRYVFVSKNLDNRQLDWIQLSFLAAFVITGFMLEAFRMAATKNIEEFAPIGAVLAKFLEYLTPEDLVKGHRGLWWFHSILTFAFIAIIPSSKFFHIFTSPMTIFFRSGRHRGQLYTPFKLTDIMEAEASGQEVGEEDFMAGVSSFQDFSWKTLLDSEACTACGRCHVVCPAQNTDKPLSPKFLVLDIKKMAANTEDVYSLIHQDVLWSCTSCNACVEECPVLIEHVDTIVDMRRGLLAQNKAPSNLQGTLKNLRTKSNPWGLDPNDREKWIQELKEFKNINVKLAKEHKGNFEYLYWVGSPGAYDDRNKAVTKAVAQLLHKAGINFAVLGNEEKTSGDIARRAGDEGLYQEITLENIEILQRYGVKKIITQCPHVYNTLKNEYPEFGLEGVEVYHHSEILAKLLDEGKIVPTKRIEETITYHDPCYLGRYNRVFDPPRHILSKIPGIKIKDIDHQREKSTCCGGGGAQIWYETPGSHINVMRLEELNEHKPNKVSVACPYCSIMLSTATTTAFPGTNIPQIEDIAVTLAKSAL